MSLDDREWYKKARGRSEDDTIAAKMRPSQDDTITAQPQRREPTEFEQLLNKPGRKQRKSRARIVALVVGVAYGASVGLASLIVGFAFVRARRKQESTSMAPSDVKDAR